MNYTQGRRRPQIFITLKAFSDKNVLARFYFLAFLAVDYGAFHICGFVAT
jgi:hypothetical protein